MMTIMMLMVAALMMMMVIPVPLGDVDNYELMISAPPMSATDTFIPCLMETNKNKYGQPKYLVVVLTHICNNYIQILDSKYMF